MKRTFKKYFISHKENEHRPHFLRERSLTVLLALIFFLFFSSIFYSEILSRTNFFAAVLPGVLADLTNQDRGARALSPLMVNPTLAHAAELKAKDMAEKGYFAHTSPEGLSPWYWMDEAGYQFLYAGENLAVYFSDSEAVNRAWLDSEKHRANILNGKFTEIGIATAEGVYNGVPTVFVVQMFGKPALASVAPISSEAQVQKSVPVEVHEEVLVPDPSPTPVSEVVAGAELKPLYEDSNFVAVANAPVEETDAPEPVSVALRYASWHERLLSSPQAMLLGVYEALAALVIFSLLFVFFGEVKKHHLVHVGYVLGLLILMASFTYLGSVSVFGKVLTV